MCSNLTTLMLGICDIIGMGKHWTICISLDKYLQIVGRWLGQHGKCCVYAKRMFSQNFGIFEKKLARRSAYLVYKGKS